jgi:hypothetical protein
MNIDCEMHCTNCNSGWGWFIHIDVHTEEPEQLRMPVYHPQPQRNIMHELEMKLETICELETELECILEETPKTEQECESSHYLIHGLMAVMYMYEKIAQIIRS